MAAPGEARPPFVLQRAHGVRPDIDGQNAEKKYQAEHPPDKEVLMRAGQHETRQKRQQRQVPAKTELEGQSVVPTAKVPAHELVLADLRQQKEMIDAAIMALEALYR
jgi:hypothetical protein